jgi:PIN domain nuclease of toxin-antitoxin system
MALYVTDTHALVWYLGKRPELSSAAQAVFHGAATGANQIVVPTIVIAELLRMIEKRRTALKISQVVAALEQAHGYQFAPLTIPIVLQIQATTSLPDLHDRFIVATALTFGATLITQDQTITQSGLIPVIW